MGLDFGSKTVGVAISDALLITAQGIEITMVLLTATPILSFAPSISFAATSCATEGIIADAIADAKARGILDIVSA